MYARKSVMLQVWKLGVFIPLYRQLVAIVMLQPAKLLDKDGLTGLSFKIFTWWTAKKIT